MEQKKLTFFSEGAQIAAELYLPANAAGKLPAVILCQGFASPKEMLLPPYALHLAENGFAALTFDYRGFGESEGERGRLVPLEQMADIRNAITFLQTLEGIDPERIALWGSSFGGANAIRVAAIDQRVKTLIAQLTFASGRRMVTGKMNAEEQAKLEATLKKLRERAVTQNKIMRMSPDQILSDEDSKAFFVEAVKSYPALNVKIPFLTLQHIIEHNPEDDIAKVECATLIIGAAQDIVCPPRESEILFERAHQPKKLVILEGCRHYDAYTGAPFEKGVAEIVQWLATHL